ncbi:MAG: hypothetical protein IJA20_02195 [Methanocorpusculum sp.]|nr:hypothetical protein [Methanocorpusculum sp.]
MGAKFANIQIQCNDVESVRAQCPQYTVTALAEGWITVLGDAIDWGTAQKEAKRLSKQLPYSILTVEYFDDDFVELTVYKEGKKAAGHVPAEYESFARSPGKPKKFIETLNLPSEEEKTLKAIFQERSPELCVHLMESLLGCVLWVDEESLIYAKPLGRDYLEEYLSRKAEQSKIKNQTKLALLDEVTGEFDYPITYPIVRYDNRGWNEKSFWSIAPDGKLHKYLEIDEPGRVDGYRTCVRSDTMTVFSVGFWGAHNGKHRLCCYTNDGELLERMENTEHGTVDAGVLNDSILFWDGLCYDMREKNILWCLDLGRTDYGIRPPQKVSEDLYAIVYDRMDDQTACLALLDMEGSIRCSVQFLNARHWSYPIIYAGSIYMYHCLDGKTPVLTCYDEMLNERWHIKVPVERRGMMQLGKPLLDESTGLLYFHIAYNRLAILDIQKREIIMERELRDDEDAYMKEVLPEVGPVMLTGDASIEVWDTQLQAISRHRTKGDIAKILRQDGHCYLLTMKQGVRTSPFADADKLSVVRLYELMPAKRRESTKQ